jgi:hypothetical protein
VRVFVNGAYYTAYLRHEDGDVYVSSVDVDYAALTTPTVMATVEWTSALEPIPGAKLVTIELR